MTRTIAEDKRSARRGSIAEKIKRGRGRPRKHPLPDAATQTVAVDVKGGTCPKCKEPLIDGETFCAKCGTDTRGPTCANCDEALRPGARYCGACGAVTDPNAKHEKVPDAKAIAAEEIRTPASGAQLAPIGGTPAPAVGGSVPIAAPASLFPKEFLMFAWVGMAASVEQLMGEDFRTLDQSEIEMLAGATKMVIDKRLALDGPNADLWYLSIAVSVVFMPRMFVVWVRYKRRKAKEEEKSDVAEKAEAAKKPVKLVERSEGADDE